MFKADDFRVKDLDELVPLIQKDETDFNIKKEGIGHFKLGKHCRAILRFDEKTGETQLVLMNSVLNESRTYGGKNPLDIEAIDLDSIMENFVVFDYFVSAKSIFGKKNTDAVKIHSLLTNVDKLLEGEKAVKAVKEIVSAEEYDKAMGKAKKAFNKEQSETIDSQTPQYDG